MKIMSLEMEIIIVSGLPRSGTSLLMQMLAAGGITVITDKLRTADADNPRGYYEVELVKKIKQDASWLPQVRGKAVKMISQLLYDLPASESYRVILMERDLDEVLVSQEKMLERLGRTAARGADEAIVHAALGAVERLAAKATEHGEFGCQLQRSLGISAARSGTRKLFPRWPTRCGGHDERGRSGAYRNRKASA